jgi:hypothetical protein
LDDIELQNVIDTINQTLPPTRANSSLQEALKNERMFGLSTNRISSNFKSFKGYYVLVEDPSGTYKPVVCKEFSRDYDPERPPWPIIYYGNHASHTVFALPSQSVQDPTEKSSDDIVEPHTKESAASGLISGSAASMMARNPGENPVIANMAQRTAEQVQKRNRESESDFPSKKNPQGQKVNPALIPAKSGYCENCNVKFDDYQKVLGFDVAHQNFQTSQIC